MPTLKLRDIMTRDVVTVPPEVTLRDAMALFAARHVSGAPVVANGEVIGVVTANDLLGLAASLPGSPTVSELPDDVTLEEREDEEEAEAVESGDTSVATYFTDLWDDAGADLVARTATSESPEWNVLEEHTVSEAMNPSVLSMPPDEEVTKAAAYMQQSGVHRILVMEDGKLQGIVTTTDIARAVAEHRLSERRFVFGKPQTREDGAWW